MTKEIEENTINFIKLKQNLTSAYYISQCFEKARLRIVEEKLFTKLRDFAQKSGYIFETDSTPKRLQFSFKKSEWENLNIYFFFSGVSTDGVYENFASTIKLEDSQKEPHQKLRALLEPLSPYGQFSDSLWGEVIEGKYKDWDLSVFIEMLDSPDELVNLIIGYVKRLSGLIERFEG